MSAMRRTRLAALAGAGALLLSGCEFSVYDLPLPGGADLGDNPYEVTVQFRDVLDLVPQSAVRVGDVAVGRVDDVQLDGYTAEVTLLVRGDVKLPDNAVAGIRQTSLLGEKFVDLAPPEANPQGKLEDGDTIELEDSGRNPEVEEVLGALSLFLNGGGVGQLKLITEELNKAFDGRESEVTSTLRRFATLMEGLDDGKAGIVRALENVNSLAISLNKETDTLDLALDELPSAIKSVDSQRADLVKMLRALARLSGVGTRVIQASKQGTIDSLNALAPVLTELARSGDDFVNSLQIVLTFPFIDGVVGKNPQQARDLHMGDYTNLDVDLELDLGEVLGTIVPTSEAPLPSEGLPTDILPTLPDVDVTTRLPDLGLPGRGGRGGRGGGGGGGGGVLDLPGGLGRAPVGAPATEREERERRITDLAGMLTWGVTGR